MVNASTWEISDLSQAMISAIAQNADPKFLKWEHGKAKFNGFWRDGDKQNVCAWTENATWHDVKTGEGGGCKEFAKIAFNMSLKQFMEKFGQHIEHRTSAGHIDIAKAFKDLPDKCAALPEGYVLQLWTQLQKNEHSKVDHASKWLSKIRGIAEPRECIGSGYLNINSEDLKFFDDQHKTFIKNRLDKGNIMGAPLRDANSDEVKNIFLRTITSVEKSEKSRLLPNCGGWGNSAGGLRAFGYPHLIEQFSSIVICEGMADYFTAEYLLSGDEKHLPIGAANAGDLVKWAQWISDKKYKGRIMIVHHLDTDNHGNLSTTEIGQAKAIDSVRIMRENGCKANIFPWRYYLENTTMTPEVVKDLADSIQSQFETKQCGEDHLQWMFLDILERGTVQ